MRIGVLKQLSYATTKTGLRSDANIDDEVAAAFENAIAELRNCGAEVVTVSMSNLFTLSDKTFSSNAASLKADLYDAFQKLLKDNNISAVIYPTYLSTPIRSGTDENGVYWSAYSQTNINNCRTLSPSAGIPEITVPIGRHSLGAGIGMEIASLKNNEQLLLDIAYSYTSAYDHRETPSGAPNDYADSYTTELSHLAACRGAVQAALDAARNFKFNHPLDKTKIHMLPIDSAAQDGFSLLRYWPFAVLAILILWVVHLIQKLRIRKRRRARQRARARQRIQ
jgi:Asp-tRNA(Asn)/Glu-tRNA(Gln) amidotransferase A subunit family amidase